MAERTHLQYLDVFKGIVIFLVVVGHAFHFGFVYYDSSLLHILKSIDMPSFLFMSGLLGATSLSFTPKGFREYWLKKSRQLLLPLLTLPILYAYLFGIDMKHLFLDRMHGGYWFTLTLFEMFVLLYGVRFLNEFVNRRNSPFVEVLIGLLSLAFVLVIDSPWERYFPKSWEALSWGKMNYLYYYFLLGYFVGRYRQLEEVLTSPFVHATSALVFIWCIRQSVVASPILEGIPASLSGLIFAYNVVKQIGNLPTRANSLLAYLGKESRTIYLTHYFFLFSAPMVGKYLKSQWALERIFMWELVSATLYAILVIAVTLVAVRLIRSSAILDTLCYGKRLRLNP